MTLKITTNHKPRPLYYRWEVPRKVLRGRLDHVDPDGYYYGGFFRFKGSWYHLSEVEYVQPGGDLAQNGWAGYINWGGNAGSCGLLFKWSGEDIVLGTYQYTND